MTPNEQDEPRLMDKEIEKLVKWACSIFSGGKNPQRALFEAFQTKCKDEKEENE